MKNKFYVLDEDQAGLLSFEGKTGKITLDELRSLQNLQPESLWIIMAQPQSVIDGKFNKQNNE